MFLNWPAFPRMRTSVWEDTLASWDRRIPGVQSYPPCGSYQSLLNNFTGYRQAVTFVTSWVQAGCCGEIEELTRMGRAWAKLLSWQPGHAPVCIVSREVPNCCVSLLFSYLLFFPLFFFPQVVLLMKCHMGLCCSRKCYFYCMLLPSHPVCTFSFQSWIQMHPQPAVLELFLPKVNENISC